MGRKRVTRVNGANGWRSARLPVLQVMLGIVLVAAALWELPDAHAAQSDSGPEQVVKRFEDHLVAIMKSRSGEAREASGFATRFAQMLPVVTETFGLDYMGQVVLGRHWRVLSPRQRDRFHHRFRELVVSAFAAEIGEYKGQIFKFDTTKPLKRGRVLVRSKVIERDGAVDLFDYVLRRVEAGDSSQHEVI